MSKNKRKKYRTVPQQVRQKEDPVYMKALYQSRRELRGLISMVNLLLWELDRVYQGVQDGNGTSKR